MDNAAYHKSLPKEYEKLSALWKAEVISKFDEIGIQYAASMSAIEAKQALKKWFSENIEPEVFWTR